MTTAEQRLFDWVSGLMEHLPYVRVDDSVRSAAGPEFDFRHAVAVYEALEPDVEVRGVWQALGAWIYDYSATAQVGAELSRDLGGVLGISKLREEDATDPLRRTPRMFWWPEPEEVEADRVAHRNDVQAAVEMIRVLAGDQEWAKRRDRVPAAIREMEAEYAPLVLSDAELVGESSDSEPSVSRRGFSDDVIRAAYARYESLLEGLERRNNVIDLSGRVAVASEPDTETRPRRRPPWVRRVVQWVAGAVATAAAAVAFILSGHPPPASVQAAPPLPLSTVAYPTCPTVERVAEPSEAVTAADATSPVALAAAAPTPAPPRIPPRRKVSPVKLTEIDGVRVRRSGHADVVISAREVTAADDQLDEQLYVIDLDQPSEMGGASTAIAMPLRGDLDSTWLVVERSQ